MCLVHSRKDGPACKSRSTHDMFDSQAIFWRLSVTIAERGPEIFEQFAEPYKKSGTKKDRAGEQLFFTICISASSAFAHLHSAAA